MAEGFTRARGGDRLVAFSAGSRPGRRVHPAAVRLMAEVGIDLSGISPKGLDEIPTFANWDYVITMGCGDACPHLPARLRLDWNLPDPKGMGDEEFRDVRDEVEKRVAGLIAELGID